MASGDRNKQLNVVASATSATPRTPISQQVTIYVRISESLGIGSRRLQAPLPPPPSPTTNDATAYLRSRKFATKWIRHVIPR